MKEGVLWTLLYVTHEQLQLNKCDLPQSVYAEMYIQSDRLINGYPI